MTTTRSKKQNLFSFSAIEFAGNLITPQQVFALGKSPNASNYHIPAGIKLNDHIEYQYKHACELYYRFQYAVDDPQISADATQQFVKDFLTSVLGFSLSSPAPRTPSQLVLDNILSPRSENIEETTPFPIQYFALDGRIPIVIAPSCYIINHKNNTCELVSATLTTKRPEFGNGTRSRTPFELCQEYLNAHENSALWGIATNGRTIRLVRNNNALSRTSYIDFHLEEILSANKFDEFRIAWLMLHASQFGSPHALLTECSLEKMRLNGIQEGSRISDRLRDGVKEALLFIGNGFLQAQNPALKQAFLDKQLNAQTYYNELLRLVYRLIFLITIEERDQLHPRDAAQKNIKRYQQGYSLSRLRDRSVYINDYDRYTDLWDAQQIVFEGLANGQRELALPALGGIFDLAQCPHLNGLSLPNDAFLKAMHSILWLMEENTLVRINWRDMGPEEFGSVYEGLLELSPDVDPNATSFAFIEPEQTSTKSTSKQTKAKGSERKTTGSYYTPDSLVQVILDHTLMPLIQRTIAKNPPTPQNPAKTVEALLKLTIVDPACGSGHFLISAARRLAEAVASERTRLNHQTTPSPFGGREVIERSHEAEIQIALRDVIKKCIYGVDLNPMAVELCRVALWLETIRPGEPLSFLDSHIQCGNSLLGTTPELMENGIPDEAWQPDNPNGKSAEDKENKEIASALKKQNANERKKYEIDINYSHLIDTAGIIQNEHAAIETQEIESAPENTIDDIRQKQSRYKNLLSSEDYKHQKQIADTWCAAFLWNKTEALKTIAPTHAVFESIRNGSSPSPQLAKEIERIAEQHHLFHWPLQFPQIFKNGGFDCVLGNPPWEKLQFEEEEFFAQRNSEIANSLGDTRKKLIKQLKIQCPSLFEEYKYAFSLRKREAVFATFSCRYPFSGKGNINLYSLFAEHNRTIMKSSGVAGFIVPSGIACDDTTADFFVDLVKNNQLSKFYSFENKEGLFPAVHRSYNFGLLMLEGEVSPHAAMATPYAAPPSAGPQSPAPQRPGSYMRPDFVFYAHKTEDLNDDWRHFSMNADDFAKFNPNSHTCMTFRSQRDKEINAKIYRRAGNILLRDQADQSSLSKADKSKTKSNKSIYQEPSLFPTTNIQTPSIETKESKTNPWQLTIKRMFNMTDDSKLFIDEHDYKAMEDISTIVPLYEAKYIHHFDAHFNTYQVTWKTKTEYTQVTLANHSNPNYLLRPCYYIDKKHVISKLNGTSGKSKQEKIHWDHNWMMGWRAISCPTNQRTFITSVFPWCGTGNSIRMMYSQCSACSISCLLANFNSYILDYAVRNKLSGTNLSSNYVEQFPVFTPSFYDRPRYFTNGDPLFKWIARRVVALVCTHHDVCDFGREVLEELGEPNFMALPHIWDDAERNEIRCQLDAAFFVLYGMNRDEVEYILSTFNSKASQSDSDEDDNTSDDESSALAKQKGKKTSKKQASIEPLSASIEVNPKDDIKPEVYGNDRHKARILELFDSFRE